MLPGGGMEVLGQKIVFFFFFLLFAFRPTGTLQGCNECKKTDPFVASEEKKLNYFKQNRLKSFSDFRE